MVEKLFVSRIRLIEIEMEKIKGNYRSGMKFTQLTVDILFVKMGVEIIVTYLLFFMCINVTDAYC